MSALVWSVVTSFILVATRIAGFVAASPFPGSHVPERQRVGLVLVLTLVVGIYVQPNVTPTELGVRTFGAGAIEVVVGLLIGLAFRMTLAAADIVGEIVSHAVGLSMQNVINPMLEARETALGSVLSIFGLALALELGVHRVVLAYLLESFRVLPVVDASALPSISKLFLDWTGEALTLGARLAMPVVGLNLIVQLVLGLVSRVAPSLQVFSVGFSVVVLSGLLAFLASFESIQAGLAAHLSSTGSHVEAILSRLARLR